MRIELRNIGPLNRAEVDLDGFSIVAGPNASGKTTLSTICYAVLLCRPRAEAAVERLVLASDRRRESRSPDPAELSEVYASSFRTHLAFELERCLGPDLAKLPRRGRTGNGSAPRIVVSHSQDGNEPWRLVFRLRDGGLHLEPRYPGYCEPRFDHIAEMSALRRMSLRRRRATHPVYFPAARSGYVQMQSVLYSLLLSALGRGLYGDISVGKIPGIASDFLQFLAGMDPEHESAIPETTADRLEEELIHGHLRVLPSETAKVIEFSPQGLEEYWTMDASATSIAEIAPLLLYCRHRATSRDLLFIDEPEAHLHPGNQIVLADILLQLSGSLQGMVIGTHSEFFVMGVSNSLLRAHVEERDLPHVKLYELVRAETTGGYVTKSSVVDPGAGFAVGQFSDVAEIALDEGEELFVRSQTEERDS